MSRNDCETDETLVTPHIEIGRGGEPHPTIGINVGTFRHCYNHLISPKDRQRIITSNSIYLPKGIKNSFYSVYGTVSPMITTPAIAYINIDEPPTSRTLIGYLEKKVVKNKLPKVYNLLKYRRT